MGVFRVVDRNEAARTIVVEHDDSGSGHAPGLVAAELKFAKSDPQYEHLTIGVPLLVAAEPLR